MVVNYPFALQPPPDGYTLPDRFAALTQIRSTRASPSDDTKTTRSSNSTRASSASSTDSTARPTSPSPTTNTTLLIDPNSTNQSLVHLNESTEIPSNVGQHVLNQAGEVDGSSIGLGKSDGGGDAHDILSANDSLSPGAKAGAIVGTLVTFLILVMMALIVAKTSRRKKAKEAVYISSDHSSDSSSSHGN